MIELLGMMLTGTAFIVLCFIGGSVIVEGFKEVFEDEE